MELEDLVQQAGKLRQDVSGLVKRLNELVRMDQDRRSNIETLKTRIEKLRETSSVLEGAEALQRSIAAWIEGYKEVLSEEEKRARRVFGTELDSALTAEGFSLTGNYPELQAGLFRLVLDFGRASADIWYGPKEEELAAKVKLGPNHVAKTLAKIRSSLGSSLEGKDFLAVLKEASERIRSRRGTDGLPISRVLAEVAFQIQTKRFRTDPRKEHYVTYGRADFSFDLFQHREAVTKRFRLETASHALTKRRSDYLWVPTNDRGDGYRFAFIHPRGGNDGD